MFIDQFWKIFFIGLLGVGCVFWWKSASAKRVYKMEVAALAEFLDSRPAAAPKTDEEAAERSYQAIAILHSIVRKKGQKFEIRTALDEVAEINNSDDRLADMIIKVTETNYKNAEGFGLLGDDDALWRMEQGSAPTIARGPWEGETAEVGYYISPDINKGAANHLANRILLPASVKAAMPSGGLTRTIDDWAERLKNAQVLKLGDREEIRIEYRRLLKAGR